MRALVLLNKFRSSFGGEYTVVDTMISILRRRGVDVEFETRPTASTTLAGKTQAFFSGIYNFSEYNSMRRSLERIRPDIVHVHNLYPRFSPSVLVACRKAGVPVVMTLHNFALTCPHWSHFVRGDICEKCALGNVSWCVVKNCQDSFFESLGYAVRSAIARQFGLFRDNVCAFIALTEFAKSKFVRAGFPPERIFVFPNPVERAAARPSIVNGGTVAYVGRLSEEKGVDCFLSAAQLLPEIPFTIAGDGPLMDTYKKIAPDNVCFLGRLSGDELESVYLQAAVLVIPSICYEMCPTVLLEGMARAIPVVVSRFGGLPEFVSEEDSGLLFERGNPNDLAMQIERLWNDRELARRLGTAAQSWVTSECNESSFFDRLIGVYEMALQDHREGGASARSRTS